MDEIAVSILRAQPVLLSSVSGPTMEQPWYVVSTEAIVLCRPDWTLGLCRVVRGSNEGWLRASNEGRTLLPAIRALRFGSKFVDLELYLSLSQLAGSIGVIIPGPMHPG